MNVEIYTLAWPDTNPEMLKAHSDVCKHLGVDVNYTIQRLPHGLWMNELLINSKADVVGFLDIDCVPTNKRVVEEAIAYCVDNKSFVGVGKQPHPSQVTYLCCPCLFLYLEKHVDKVGQPHLLRST